MELQITGKNLEVSDSARQYVEKKIGKLVRYLPDITEAKVEMALEMTRAPEHRHVVQVTLFTGGTFLRGEERGPDFYAAVDRVENVLARQIDRYKDKLHNNKRGRIPSPAKGGPAEEGEPVSEGRGVVKVKRFALRPMSVDEAIDQMELLDHTFFLFLNSATQKVNLLYLRKDKNYGIIEPDLG